MKIPSLIACSLLLSVIGGNACATTYAMPKNGDTVVTEFPDDDAAIVRAEQNETLLDVARRHLLGQTEIVRLNPDRDRWLIRKGETIRLSNRHILPDTPHEGITLNIAEYRMYYYPPTPAGTPTRVMSFAHGVGRQDWKTPLGKTSVVKKVKDPSWYPPESIRREHAANGDPLPLIVPPGPHNPLGAYALHLNLPGEYRIHGTDIDKIYGIGMQITHGCVRMYPEDVQVLYNSVSVGTPVYIVKQPIKVGWLDNTLYIEAHPDLEGEEMTLDQRYAVALGLIQKATHEEMPDFDQAALNQALKGLTGDPVPIYERLPPINEVPSLTTEAEPVIVPAPKVKPVPAKQAKASPVSRVKAKPVYQAKKAAPVSKSKAGAVAQAKTKSATTRQAKAGVIRQVKATQTGTVKGTSKKGGSPGGYYRGS